MVMEKKYNKIFFKVHCTKFSANTVLCYCFALTISRIKMWALQSLVI